MATAKFYLDIRRPLVDGTFPLRIVICERRKKAYIPLDIRIKKEQWDEKNGVVINHPNKLLVNGAIKRKLAQVEELVLKLAISGELDNMSASDIRDLFLQPEEKPKNDKFEEVFVEFMEKKKGSTRELYAYTLNLLHRYCPKLDKVKFDDITVKWLEGFDSYLMEGDMLKNSRNIHFRNIRAVFNYAIGEEITVAYPFRRFKIRPEATRKRSLSVEELRILFDYPVEPYAEIYRDMFKLIFMLIGINTVDLHRLKEVTKDGRIEYTRAKTHRLYSIKVEPEAAEIIEKYRGKNGLLTIADRFSDHRNFRHQINKAIQRFGHLERKGRGGKKFITPAFPEVTTYWARHTWATIAYQLDIPKDIIAQALGHSSGLEVTEIYIDRDNRKVDDANRKVLDWVLYGKK